MGESQVFVLQAGLGPAKLASDGQSQAWAPHITSFETKWLNKFLMIIHYHPNQMKSASNLKKNFQILDFDT